VGEGLPGILAGGSCKLSGAVLVLLAELKQELEQLAEKINRADKSIEKIARENESCRRLVAMPGGRSCNSNGDQSEQLSKRIVLIDGGQLTRLMIRHGVGCRIEEPCASRKWTRSSSSNP
jgi:hypothetical protein